MKYFKGDRVKHPKCEQWGVGEVLADSTSDSVQVFFIDAGQKTLSLKHVLPIKLSETDAVCPMLDNITIGKSSSKGRYKSLKNHMDFFQKEYPDGFYGQKFAEMERNYKVKAHELTRELLSIDVLSKLLQDGEYAEICKRALKSVNATNLVFPNEKMALKDGLVSQELQRLFAETLVELLHGADDLECRFSAFCKTLESIGADKWTIATYFLFVMYPEQHMFIKPTMTQFAADACKQEINYKSDLNWLTYKQVLEFAGRLKVEIAELKPRDMIDVQSFMWCISPNNA